MIGHDLEILKILMEIKDSGRAVLMATHNYNILKQFKEKTFKCENGKLLLVDNNSPIDFSSLD